MGPRGGIVHIGVGNFHRSHQAVYVDRLPAEDRWGICGVGMLAADAGVRDGLRAQAFRYNLLVKHPDGRLERQLVGSLHDMLLTPEDPWAVVARIADPGTRLVTLTITEGGYFVDDQTGAFDADAPAIRADAVPGAPPRTTFGVLAHALAARRSAGLTPFTVASCDNIDGNGRVARRAVVGTADLIDPALGRWIEEAVAFPNSMVDRITPQATEADRALLRERWGVDDAVLVTAEPFAQWVLEDTFTDGRPRWEDVGVQLTTDVRPYELMKLRLLNAGHQALAYFGLLLGYDRVDEAAADPDLIALLRRYMQTEARPTLQPVPGVDLDAYVDSLLTRFANPGIRDTLLRLAAHTSDRIPKFVLPVVRANLAAGRPVDVATSVVASWLHHAEVRPAEVEDPRAAGRQPRFLLDDPAIFGDLAADATFGAAVRQAILDLEVDGPRAMVRRLAG